MARGINKGRRSASNSHARGVREADVSDDEIDAFHDQRDKILLEGSTSRKSSRDGPDPYDTLAATRSVLDVDEAESSVDDADVEDDEEESDIEDDGRDADVGYILSKAQTGKVGAAEIAQNFDDEDDEGSLGSAQEDEDDLVGGWGSNKKAYYNTNNLDELESDSEMDEEEKRAMELREVKKLQQRNRQGMVDEDFGIGEQEADADSGVAAREQRRKDLDLRGDVKSRDKPREVNLVAPQNPAELIARVQRDTPETLALIGEFADVVDDLNAITDRMANLQTINPDHPSLGLLHVHHQTLLTYVTTLIFYFYVRANSNSPSSSNGKGSGRAPMYAIIERLAKLKAGLAALEGFGLGADEDSDEESAASESGASVEGDEEGGPISFLFKPRSMLDDDSSGEEGSQSLGSLEDDELAQLEAENKENHVRSLPQQSKASNGAKSTNGGDKEPKKKKKDLKRKEKKSDVAPLASVASMLEDDDGDIADEMAPISKRRKQMSGSTSFAAKSSGTDVYSEPTRLDTVDQADKEAIRRSLKFHTGQVDARDGRSAGRKLEGDLDIPYRDKDRSRQTVAASNANKAAKALGVSTAHRQLDEDEFGEDDARDWRDVMDVDGDIGVPGGKQIGNGKDEAYYDLITSSRKSDKQARKAQHDEDRMASRVAPGHANLEDGEHRAINRQIEKNRGLTPRRPKASRNPRVKKRMRYEKAQKKLSSRGPVYKGGQGALQGGYGGESSGISSNVVKSRQFA